MPTLETTLSTSGHCSGSDKKLKLGLVGCGAVAERTHLPILTSSATPFEVAVLVDASTARAQQLAQRYHVPNVMTDYSALVGAVDAVMVALPNHMHAPATIHFLKHGIHVLVEKPMAISVHECNQMIEAAAGSQAVLAVGLDMRFFDAYRFVKEILATGMIGTIKSVDLQQGSIDRWPATTDARFGKHTAGGGVLTDEGVHMLDLLLWWLGPYSAIEYYDDAVGGVEANCLLSLRMECGALGRVELSRTRMLRNTWLFQGERGTVEVDSWGYDPIIRVELGNNILLSGRTLQRGSVAHTKTLVFNRQLEDFASAIRGGQDPFVSGEEGKRAVELIERCYAVKQPLIYPWSVASRLQHENSRRTTYA
jgi:predicted dehydrogenase